MVVVEYNAVWPIQFNKIRGVLDSALSNIVSIEHVGSTAIPNMIAKPIIDIDIEIEDCSCFEEAKKELVQLGYSYEGNQGIENREVFKRIKGSDVILDKIDHHLYVCPSNSEEYHRHILFRDYLRSNDKAVMEYCQIKWDILQKYGNDNRAKYVEVKETECRWFFEKRWSEIPSAILSMPRACNDFCVNGYTNFKERVWPFPRKSSTNY